MRLLSPVLIAVVCLIALTGCKRRPPGPPVGGGEGPQVEAPGPRDPTSPTRPFDIDPNAKAAGRTVYLAMLTPFAYQAGPWDLGIGVKGEDGVSPLVVQKKQYKYGICLHPPQPRQGTCRVSFVPGGEFKRFKGWVDLGDWHIDPWGPVVFAAEGDGRRLWESQALTKSGAAIDFDIDVTGVKVLTLETRVTRGDHSFACAIWLDPWLER